MYEYSAWLVRLVDGDTMHVGIDLGLDIAAYATIRLYGINAPEMSTDTGKAAKAWVSNWFLLNTLNGRFILRTHKDQREKYGRYLGTVVGVGGKILNDDMVAAEQAVPYLP